MEPKKTTPFNHILACNTFAYYLNNLVREEGKEPFTFTKTNRPVIKNLVHYFCNQPGELDLKKGICLRGPTGTGKTTLMRAFSLWRAGMSNRFRMVNCRDIKKEASIKGLESLNKYTTQSYNFKNGMYHRENGAIIYCFDDFGAEKTTKFYGTEINVIEEIMQDRYNEFDIYGMKTHATSNIKDGDVIEELYGVRVRDRLRQMFNFVELDGATFRR